MNSLGMFLAAGFVTLVGLIRGPKTKGPRTKGPRTKGPGTKGPRTKGPRTKGPGTKKQTSSARFTIPKWDSSLVRSFVSIFGGVRGMNMGAQALKDAKVTRAEFDADSSKRLKAIAHYLRVLYLVILSHPELQVLVGKRVGIDKDTKATISLSGLMGIGWIMGPGGMVKALRSGQLPKPAVDMFKRTNGRF